MKTWHPGNAKPWQSESPNDKALAYYQRSLMAARQIGARVIGDTQAEETDLANIGIAYRYLGQDGKAKDFERQASVLAEAGGPPDKVRPSLLKQEICDGDAFAWRRQRLNELAWSQEFALRITVIRGPTVHFELGVGQVDDPILGNPGRSVKRCLDATVAGEAAFSCFNQEHDVVRFGVSAAIVSPMPFCNDDIRFRNARPGIRAQQYWGLVAHIVPWSKQFAEQDPYTIGNGGM